MPKKKSKATLQEELNNVRLQAKNEIATLLILQRDLKNSNVPEASNTVINSILEFRLYQERRMLERCGGDYNYEPSTIGLTLVRKVGA